METAHAPTAIFDKNGEGGLVSEGGGREEGGKRKN